MEYFSDIGRGLADPLGVGARMPGFRFTGNLVMATAVLTLEAAMASGEICKLLKLPKECIPVPRLSGAVANADPGTFVCTVGTLDTPDLLSSALTVVESKVTPFVENAAFYALGVPTQLKEQSWIVATLDATVAATADVQVMFEIAWIMP